MTRQKKGVASVYEAMSVIDPHGLAVKAQLVAKLGSIIKKKRWSQAHAAEVLGTTELKLARVLSSRFNCIDEAEMFSLYLAWLKQQLLASKRA